MPMLWRLFVLVAVAVLPAVAIQTYNEIDLRRSRQVEVQDQALGLAKLAAAEQQQIVQGIHQALIALSELPAIKAKDTQACNAYLATIKQKFPAFLTFSVADTSGELFCDTNGHAGAVTVAHRPYFAKAMHSGAFAVGEFSVGLSSGRNVLVFALPFYGDDARIGGVVIAALGLDWLADYIARKGVPPGAALAITDRDGTVLARYPNNDRFVGTKMPDDKHLSPGGAGTADTVGIDGVARLVGYAALPADSGGLVVSFGLDKAQAFAAIQHRTQRGLLLIILGTALVLILTWLGARRCIYRPLGQLVAAANQLRLGDYSRRVTIHERQSEFARVGGAFNTMADALEDRERELRAAKEKAEDAAARITTVFESTTDSVLLVDPGWRITYINARAKAQLADGRDLIGVDLRRAVPGMIKTEIGTRLRQALSGRRPDSFETFCPDRDAWYAINAFSSSQGLAIYFRDVTEHKRALEAHRVIEEQLHQSQKMEAIGQLTGGIAHDFNNLLAAILSNLNLLRKRMNDEDRACRLVDGAIHGAERGAALTRRLLAFARQQGLFPRNIAVPELVAGMSDLMRRSLGPEIQITTAFPDSLPTVNADPNQLELVLLNLIVNARDAMPSGGAIAISARVEIVDERRASGLKPGSYVCVSVRDTGLGMDEATLARATEPFFSTKEIGKGTGLGLSMAHGFAAQSGGMLKLASQRNVGTTVEIWLPEGRMVARDAPAPRRRSQTRRKCTVLVVDDDTLVAGATVAMLEDLGHTVLEANSGERALEILAENRAIDAVITDQSMPRMTGLQLARRIRERWPDMPIVIATGHTDLVEHGKLEFPGLAKPFDQEDLAELLAAVVTGDRKRDTMIALRPN